MSNRVRVDFKGSSGVSITKSSIVEAVRLLEQSNDVELRWSSRELVDKVSSRMRATRFHNTVRIEILGYEQPSCHRYFTVEDNKIEGVDVSLALPREIADLIKSSSLIRVCVNSDEFV